MGAQVFTLDTFEELGEFLSTYTNLKGPSQILCLCYFQSHHQRLIENDVDLNGACLRLF